MNDPCRPQPVTDNDRTFFKNIDHLQRYHPGLDDFVIPDDEEPTIMALPTEWTTKRWITADPSNAQLTTAELVNVRTGETREGPVFIKSIHLLDPVGLLHKDYALPVHPLLPHGNKAVRNTLQKLHSSNNQAYVDAVTSYVLSRMREANATPNCILCYGSLTGIANTYSYKISDEFPSYKHQRWFWRGLLTQKGALELIRDERESFDPMAWETLQKQMLACPFDRLDDMDSVETEELDIEDVGEVNETGSLKSFNFEETEATEADATEAIEDSARSANSGDSCTSAVKDANHCEESEESDEEDDDDEDDEDDEEDDEEDEDDDEDDEDDEDEEDEDDDDDEDEDEDSEGTERTINVHLKLPTMPVIMVFQEAQEGTMDSLFDAPDLDGHEPGSKEYEKRWTAWVFQVVAVLSLLQKTLCFTHNDLHTNNVLWRKTDLPYLYYKSSDGTTWRVPTYGRIFSLIDFGRAIFRIEASSHSADTLSSQAKKSEGHLWISDDHWPGNDAGGQYNFGPFLCDEEEKCPPNPSFDLARLAISMLEGLYIDHPPKRKGARVGILSKEDDWIVHETISPLFNLLWTWTTTDEGETLFEDEYGEDKYPGFELYMRIARDCHNAVPKEQLRRPLFDTFKFSDRVPEGQSVYWT
jgi:hypothetical protein